MWYAAVHAVMYEVLENGYGNLSLSNVCGDGYLYPWMNAHKCFSGFSKFHAAISPRMIMKVWFPLFWSSFTDRIRNPNFCRAQKRKLAATLLCWGIARPRPGADVRDFVRLSLRFRIRSSRSAFSRSSCPIAPKNGEDCVLICDRGSGAPRRWGLLTKPIGEPSAGFASGADSLEASRSVIQFL